MSSEINNGYFQYNLNTVQNVRKECNIDKTELKDQAIEILSNWIKKQEHFLKKDLPRDYIEQFLISAKGSVEVAKTRIDKLYTMQTLVPHLFKKYHARKDFPNLRNFFTNVMMPTICEDDTRFLVGRLISKNITPSHCLESYQHMRIILEYAKLHDYSKGVHIVYDFTDINIADAVSNMDWVEFRNSVNLSIEAYGFRIFNIYIISASTVINMGIAIIKQTLSEKMGKRIHVVKNMEALHQLVPKRLLPEDFGGEQKTLLELYDEQNEALCSEEHVAHMETMLQARTNEKLRSSDTFDKEYLGMPGSFKMLSVD